jgi:Zn-dependent peptidase ImmA (M78 family)
MLLKVVEMLPEIAVEELGATLDRVVAEVLAESRFPGPPVDAFRLAEDLKICVAIDDRQSVRARFVRLQGTRGPAARGTILLRPEPRPERRQWAVAHEIGEHLAHRVFDALSIDPRVADPRAREMVANSLAGRLLVPGAWLGDDGPACGWDLLRLKALYRTASHELLARRMLDMPPPVIVTIFDREAIYFRAGNVRGQVPPPSPAEWDCYRSVHRDGRPCQRDGDWLTVRGWPVHEEGWKREILRTEVAWLD